MGIVLTILKSLGSAFGKAAIALLLRLATEKFAKDILVMVLDFVAKKTATEIDDKAVAILKENLK